MSDLFVSDPFVSDSQEKRMQPAGCILFLVMVMICQLYGRLMVMAVPLPSPSGSWLALLSQVLPVSATLPTVKVALASLPLMFFLRMLHSPSGRCGSPKNVLRPRIGMGKQDCPGRRGEGVEAALLHDGRTDLRQAALGCEGRRHADLAGMTPRICQRTAQLILLDQRYEQAPGAVVVTAILVADHGPDGRQTGDDGRVGVLAGDHNALQLAHSALAGA